MQSAYPRYGPAISITIQNKKIYNTKPLKSIRLVRQQTVMYDMHISNDYNVLRSNIEMNISYL